MKIIAPLLLLVVAIALADDRMPNGSKMSFTVTTNSENRVQIQFHNHTTGSNWTDNGPWAFPNPWAYKDPDSGILIYVESDGRHISAIDPDGKILWCRDPFVDAKLKFYRTKTPRITYIGKSYSGQIGIGYDSTQAGNLDIKTGEFHFRGQD